MGAQKVVRPGGHENSVADSRPRHTSQRTSWFVTKPSHATFASALVGVCLMGAGTPTSRCTTVASSRGEAAFEAYNDFVARVGLWNDDERDW